MDKLPFNYSTIPSLAEDDLAHGQINFLLAQTAIAILIELHHLGIQLL